MLDRVAPMISVAVLVFVLAAGSARAGSPEVVTACGQEVVNGVLANDLDCSLGGGLGVHRTLDLAGFTITGYEVPAVVCLGPGKCRITGPGTIVGAPGSWTVYALKKADLRDVVVAGGQIGVLANRAVLRGVEISGATEAGVLVTRGVRMSDTVLTGNTRGIKSRGRVNARGSTITGNLLDGIAASAGVILRNTEVTGNATDQAACDADLEWLTLPPCTPGFFTGFHCADVASDENVRLKGTSTCGSSLIQDGVCETSVDYRSGPTHGVCAND